MEFGLSDRGFAKLRRRYKVPVPPRGYWARIHVGQSVQRIPLPSVSQANLSTIEINFRERQPAVEGTATEGNGVPATVVAQARAISHPIPLLIEQCFARSGKADTGLPIPKHDTAVPIHVSAGQLSRALRICEVLLDALANVGWIGGTPSTGSPRWTGLSRWPQADGRDEPGDSRRLPSASTSAADCGWPALRPGPPDSHQGCRRCSDTMSSCSHCVKSSLRISREQLARVSANSYDSALVSRKAFTGLRRVAEIIRSRMGKSITFA